MVSIDAVSQKQFSTWVYQNHRYLLHKEFKFKGMKILSNFIETAQQQNTLSLQNQIQ